MGQRVLTGTSSRTITCDVSSAGVSPMLRQRYVEFGRANCKRAPVMIYWIVMWRFAGFVQTAKLHEKKKADPNLEFDFRGHLRPDTHNTFQRNRRRTCAA